MITVNAIGDTCPIPVVKTKKAIEALTQPDTVETLVDNEIAVENLKKMASKIDTTKMKNPSFLMVLTATGKYSYKREDGVYIVPIGCLKD